MMANPKGSDILYHRRGVSIDSLFSGKIEQIATATDQSKILLALNRLSFTTFGMNYVAWIVFVAAAVLEVGGDALIRQGLKEKGIILMIAGFLMLGIYGFVVNMVKWDFSKLLGVYVAVFAAVSIMVSRYYFGEKIPMATWIGLAIIIAGGMVIQFGSAH